MMINSRTFLWLILLETLLSFQIEQCPRQFKINENCPKGTIVGHIDVIPFDSITMQLIDDAHGRFQLNELGQILTSDRFPFDYELENQYDIRLRFNNQSSSIEQVFRILIEDLNEAPMNLQCSDQTGFCTAIDEDWNQTLTFKINTSSSSSSNETNETFMELICIDNGYPSLSTSIWLKVLPDLMTFMFVPVASIVFPLDRHNKGVRMDTHENQNSLLMDFDYQTNNDRQERQRRQANALPEDIYFDMFYLTVPENSRDLDIAKIFVADADKDNYTCSISTLHVDDAHQPFEIVNGILRARLTMHNNNYDLDFEAEPKYQITITCYDPIHHNTISKNFTLIVSDVNEAPIELILTPNTLPENSPAGYIIGELSAIDPDTAMSNQTFTYSIMTDPHNLFTLDGNKLILTSDNDIEMCITQPDLCPHDFEQINSLFVRIQVSDSGQPQAHARFWLEIKLIDENDPPENLQLDQNTIDEHSPIGTLIGSFSVQDQDLSQTQTYQILEEDPISSAGSLFFIEDNNLRLARVPDYEQEQFILISVQAVDSGQPSKSITSSFLIEVIDLDELPKTFAFIPNPVNIVPNETIENLIAEKPPMKTYFVPERAYHETTLGDVVFIIQDHDRELTLNGTISTTGDQLGFSKPVCESLSEKPFRLLCRSTVYLVNRRFSEDYNGINGHIISTQLTLTSDAQKMIFSKPLRIKFENITLTLNNQTVDSIDIRKDLSSKIPIGNLGALDLAAGRRPINNITLNPKSSANAPFELINGTIFKIRDGINLSVANLPSQINVSVLVTTSGDDPKTVEKFLLVNIRDKRDFNVSLTDNKILESSRANNSIGNIILENALDNFNISLINDGGGRFKLKGNQLLVASNYHESCSLNRTCPFDHETEPIINITVAIRDPTTNETLRQVTFPIEVGDENEQPYNLTLYAGAVSENATVGSTVGFVNAFDDDRNQTLTYSTENAIFTIEQNRLVLKTPVEYEKRQFISVLIRATDNGYPVAFTEKVFIVNFTATNRPPIDVSSINMTVILDDNVTSVNATPPIVAQLIVTDPDVNENFILNFSRPNLRALPVEPMSTVIADDGTTAQVYNISIVDLDPPSGLDKEDYLTDVTTNITDSDGNAISHEFFIHYVTKSNKTSTIISSTPLIPTTPSLARVQHTNIYENTPPGIPFIRGVLHSLILNSSLTSLPTCLAQDEQNRTFPISITNSSQNAFLISLPENYSLNATIRPTFMINVLCHTNNRTTVDEDIIVNVLPAPPPLTINFNQTKPFYANNNPNDQTILGHFSPIELTTTPTNRTYNLSLVNNQDIFQLLPNGSLIQIGPYPTSILQSNEPKINLTVEAIETTPDQATRIVRQTFSVPILFNTTEPVISFSEISLRNNTNPNSIIGNFTISNVTGPYRLELIDDYDKGLELDPLTYAVTLKRPLNTYQLVKNNTQLLIPVRLVDSNNQTVTNATFPLNILYPNNSNPCENKDCGFGQCVPLDEKSSYCLCENGFLGLDCRQLDPCYPNPCLNSGTCYSFSSTDSFQCQCPSMSMGLRCENLLDMCRLNSSSCPSTFICVSMMNYSNNVSCVSRDDVQYLVFDYLNDYKFIQVVDDENLPNKLLDFINENLFPINRLVVVDRRKLGPYKYDRAELFGLIIPMNIGNESLLDNALKNFCNNDSLIKDWFAREICSGYQQTIYLRDYFNLNPNFCPNCSFIDAADQYYWFDQMIPLFPLWISLIVASILMAGLSLIPFNFNAPKKVTLPLMKAKMNPEEEQIENLSILVKSVRSAAKSYRERNDSGYESDDNVENYLDEIIAHQQKPDEQQRIYHVYPILHGPRSPTTNERRRITIDNSSPRSRRSSVYPQRVGVRRAMSVSPQQNRRIFSDRNSQTLKPIIHRRSTIFDSSIGSLIRVVGSPRLNNDDETYISTRFRSSNTSKFVIGTLWNTFALVNNLFLQRPRQRRDAIAGETNIQAEQLAHLQRLYSLAETNQSNENPSEQFHSTVTSHLLQPKISPEKIQNLQSIIFDILSSTENHRCTCFENHHLSSCLYYDHSLPYYKPYSTRTNELERIVREIRRTNRIVCRDASTQSSVEKPMRIFTHSRPQHYQVKVESGSTFPLRIDASTQSSPMQKKSNDKTTQSSPSRKHLSDVSTQSNLISVETSTSWRSQPIRTNNVSTQISPIHHQTNSTQIDDDEIHRAHSTVIERVEQESIDELHRKSPPIKQISPIQTSQKVRNLVSMFESPTTTTNPISSLIENEDLHVSNAYDTVEQYANEVASSIVDNAVLTATTTTLHHRHHHQQQPTTTAMSDDEKDRRRRFSLYNNAGGFGKSLLFQTNTFVPTVAKIEKDEDDEDEDEEKNNAIRVASRGSNLSLNESRHTLIVGRHIDIDRSSRSERRKHRSLTVDQQIDSSSTSSIDVEQRQYLSNSELLSAQQLYIRPWIVRRATAPDIHCLDNQLADTRVESSTNETFFTVFPTHDTFDIYTRLTCLITILFYLKDIHDEYSNRILYDEIEQILNEILHGNPSINSTTKIHSNVFQTINTDGSKRYRTGVLLELNGSPPSNNSLIKIALHQIQWKRVKLVVRRFRKKYLRHQRLMKIDTKIDEEHQRKLDLFLKHFDSTSRRRVKKYARHYAEKID